MANEVKAPFKPYYIASAERIKDIAELMINLSTNIDVEYDQIETIANEIIFHCKYARYMDKKEVEE